jgi:TPR repeat protein
MQCKSCDYEGSFAGGVCPNCHEGISLSDEEIKNLKSELDSSLSAKEYEKAIECYEILTSLGDTDAEREYAKILENGVLATRDTVRARELYKRAAYKNDPQSAYRYSRCLANESVDGGVFWLMFSAVLGEKEAYPKTARELSAMGREKEANHFYTLASECDHKESSVILARRYCDGVGFDEPCEAYAKWHIKKYFFPPIYALPLIFKLRKIKAKEPPRVEFNEAAFLKFLLKMSLDVEADSATLKLCEILGSRGDLEALASMAMMKIRSIGTSGKSEEGMKTLRECAIRGSSEAYMTLGELYREGEYVIKDINAAVFNYEKAAKVGRADAYEELGDIFTSGESIERDFARALGYYQMAAKLGSLKGERRANEIISERDTIYRRATLEPDDAGAYRLFAISAAMGHPTAMLKLAECYENGRGTKRDGRSAYNFYLEAAEKGENAALVPLGICYLDGFGVNRDFSLALKIFTRAERLGDRRAGGYITRIYEQKKSKIAKRVYSQAMRLVHLGKFNKAVELLSLAETLEYPKAIYSLGCLYEFGMGVPTDKDRAYAMYERAYKLMFRDPRARFKLSILRKAKAVL